MFLKRLTMKGFKSFADTTVLEFEPGVTAVVGPNGSGKSNVVDAVAWVLGAQSTRALRSQRMDDVIFMGTASRPALGRAEVALTLDNGSGRLPVEGAEVTISRTLFRNGDSEYAINGTTCRLLDIQELLSDSGVGRQQHMIIGQGQLDAILTSTPENRRAVIEEAAGVLKHRRRKERAQRRLEATQENLERLGDLVREVRRQMRPLERQAASARSFAEIETDLRAARHALVAERHHTFAARRRELEAELAGVEAAEREGREELVTLDARAQAVAAEMASRREETLASTLGRLSALAERARGAQSVIAERDRALRAALAAAADENVIATLEADAARLGADLAALESEEAELAAPREELATARAAFASAQAQVDQLELGASEGVDLGALETQRARVALLERSLEAASEGRLRAARRAESARATQLEARRRLAELVEQATESSARAERAGGERDEAEAALALATAEVERSGQVVAEAASQLASAEARAEALGRALEELSGAGGREIVESLEGVLGSLLDLVEVDEGAEAAVESALGASVGAVVVDGRQSARAALAALRREGGAGIVVAAAEGAVDELVVPPGARALRGRVRPRAGAPSHVAAVLDTLLARAVEVGDWEAGLEVALARPDLVVVTPQGDRFAASGWRVASGRALVTRSAVEAALASAEAARGALETAREAEAGARALAKEAAERAGVAREQASRALVEAQGATSRQLALDAEIASREQELAAFEAEVAEAEVAALAAEEELSLARTSLPELESALAEARQRAEELEEARTALALERAALEELTRSLASAEVDLRARRDLLERRRVEVEERLAGRGAERAEAARRREGIEADLAALARLAVVVERASEEVSLAQAAMDTTYREQLEASRAGAELLESIRRERHRRDQEMAGLAERQRRADIELAELGVKQAGLVETSQRELGQAPADLGPAPELDLPEGVSVEARVGELEARLTSLGPINPLALEELSALEERYRDLDAQVSDVRHARRELQEVIRALDEEIMVTFSAAFADVNEHFAHLVGMLFPGGQGRLTLTEPDDPLNTGVEIEVRPMGRNIRRISLLSGGERSMVTLAFLFAVFRSRPSPFYLMDEVEAALDDVNLQRFLSLVDEFRDEAQLLVVTHQKRTMEAADALYGVTMVPGASSKVVSQRVSRGTPVVA